MSITVSGVSGVVDEVSLGTTILTDEDGVKITIPNKHIVGEILHNSEEKRIVEEIVGISYNSDPEKAIQIIKEVLNEFRRFPRGLLLESEFRNSVTHQSTLVCAIGYPPKNILRHSTK